MKNWSIFEQLTPDFVQNPDQIHENLIIFFVSCPVSAKILVKSLRGCEKWILQKILHRSSDSKKFPSKKISSKKWNLKFEKYFSKKCIYIFFNRRDFHIKFFYNWLFEKIEIFFRWKISVFFLQIFKIIFFPMIFLCIYFFGPLDRCKIFRRIHFSHPWSDLTSILALTGQEAKFSSFFHESRSQW